MRRYANLAENCQEAIKNYAKDVTSKEFPDSSESFAFPPDEEAELRNLIDEEEVVRGELTC